MQDEIARKHRRGAADHAHAAGTAGARRQADREPPGLRSLSARPELRAADDAPGLGVRAADVRERGRARPDVRPRACGDRQRLRAVSQPLRARRRSGSSGPRPPASAPALGKAMPEILVAEAWMLYAEAKYDDAIQRVREAIDRKPDIESGYYLLGRALFAAGKHQEVATSPRRRWRPAARTTTSTSRS